MKASWDYWKSTVPAFWPRSLNGIFIIYVPQLKKRGDFWAKGFGRIHDGYRMAMVGVFGWDFFWFVSRLGFAEIYHYFFSAFWLLCSSFMPTIMILSLSSSFPIISCFLFYLFLTACDCLWLVSMQKTINRSKEVKPKKEENYQRGRDVERCSLFRIYTKKRES